MAKKRRRRKKRKSLKIRLCIALIVLMFAAIAVLVVLKVFTVKQVVVEGNEFYSSMQIEEMVLNDEYSWNSLYVLCKYRLRDVGKVPFVDEMKVSLDNPHTVRISVYEKGILGSFYIDSLGQYAYFDKDGFVVETSADEMVDVPKITGISCDSVVLYEKLPLEKENVLDRLLALTQILKKYNIAPEKIHYDSGMQAVLDCGAIEVMVGSEHYLTPKISRLAAIMPQLSGLSGTLHLERWTPDTTDVVFERS